MVGWWDDGMMEGHVTYLPCICRSNALGASSNAKTESRIGWMDSVCAPMSTGFGLRRRSGMT